ncbi:MAG: hypothetical protein AAF958_18205, partial [Planctomycetota bacterium]
TGVTAATMTIDGKALFATTMGIQCFDQPGRVHLIIDSPVPGQPIERLTLRGRTLEAVVGGNRYTRAMAVAGVPEGKAVRAPKPRL